MAAGLLAVASSVAPLGAQGAHAAVIASFQSDTGILRVDGDTADNTITIGRDLNGKILINGGSITIKGVKPSVDNTTQIQMFGQDGSDRLVFDLSNGALPRTVFEGGTGFDTVELDGADTAEVFSVTPNVGRLRVDRSSPSLVTLDAGSSEALVVYARGGDDTFSATGDLASLIQITVDGGEGNDTLNGSNGADVLVGGNGHDVIDGNQGSDVVLLGPGDDIARWDPGDGNDTIEGQADDDTLIFNGANIGELVDVSANLGRVRLTRNVGGVTLDLNGLEAITFKAVGGADTVVVNDLTGTDLLNIQLDLNASVGGGDAQSDLVVVNATNGDDSIQVGGSSAEVVVSGSKAAVKILGAEGTYDRLAVNAVGGADFVDASTLAAGLLNLSLSGGPGDDLLLGSQGDDMILGNQGNDIVFMELGNDTFTWNPGDGSDVLEGQGGTDALIFNGSNASERIDIGPSNQRVRVARDISGVVLDIDKIERIDLNPIGGADTLTIDNLSNTAAGEINVRLAATLNGTTGDGVVDTVVINGTGGVDQFPIKGGLSGIALHGPWAIVNVTASEGANDVLRVNALGGDDVMNAYQLAAGAIKLTLDGGPGNDQILGSAGNDVLDGGEGYDILIGGPGTDVGLNGEEVYEIP